jgi:hypothetical protein
MTSSLESELRDGCCVIGQCVTLSRFRLDRSSITSGVWSISILYLEMQGSSLLRNASKKAMIETLSRAANYVLFAGLSPFGISNASE